MFGTSTVITSKCIAVPNAPAIYYELGFVNFTFKFDTFQQMQELTLPIFRPVKCTTLNSFNLQNLLITVPSNLAHLFQ